MFNLKVLLVSNNKSIAQDIAKELRKNHCSINYLTYKNAISFAKNGSFENTIYNYFIIVDLPEGEEIEGKRIDREHDVIIGEFLKVARSSYAKTVFIFPYNELVSGNEKYSELIKKILNDKEIFASVLFSGEIYKGSEIITGKGPFFEISKSLAINGSAVLERNKDYYIPLESILFAKLVIKKLFSISSFGKSVAILSSPISFSRIKTKLERLYGKEKFTVIKKNRRVFEDVDNKEYVKVSAGGVFNKIFTKELVTKIRKDSKKYIRPAKTIGRRHKRERGLKLLATIVKKISISDRKLRIQRVSRKLLLIVLLTALTPIFLLLINIIGIKTSLYLTKKGYLDVAEVSLGMSKVASSVNNKLSGALSNIPLMGYPYDIVEKVSGVLSEETDFIEGGIMFRKEVIKAIGMILSDEAFDVGVFSTGLSLEIDHLIKNISFLKSDIKDFPKVTQRIANSLVNNDLLQSGLKLKDFNSVIKLLPTLLGEKDQVTYLLVLQNDSILRASGGIVESVALVTFSEGKLHKVEIYSVDVLDRMIGGIIEPPNPINNYFNKDSWYLRDSNWFVDFTKSAEQMEWFIDKEIDESVDGVIALNFNLFLKLIDIYEKIAIEGDDVIISKENVSNALKSSAFVSYPDKRSGRDISGKLLEGMIFHTRRLTTTQKSNLIDLLMESLDEKEIQVFIHDNESREVFADIGWDGGVNTRYCNNNCYRDYLVLVESDLEGNTENEVNKQVSLSVSIEEGLVKRELIYFIENEGEGADNNVYKSYVRIFVPPDSGFGLVDVVRETERQKIEPEVFGVGGSKEAGIYIQVEGGETIALVFSWESGTNMVFGKDGEYELKWIKQSGTDNYLVETEIVINAEANFGYENLSLTGEKAFGYNTNLSRDIISRIFWKNATDN